MTVVFLKIVNMSIAAGWLVLAALLLRILLSRAPKWSHVLLWGIVALRLLFPFSIESALSLIPSTETVQPSIMMDASPSIDSGIHSIDQMVNPVISQVFEPAPYASANPLQILIPVSSIIWLTGIVLLIVYTLISYGILHRKVRTAIPMGERVYQSEHIGTPFVLGIFRPRIYLSFAMDPADQELVIAHEKAHIHRKDHWWKPLGFLLLTIHWFNPLMWIAYAMLCRDIEQACDEKVVKNLAYEQRADYSQALLNCNVQRRFISACPLAYAEVGVKKRIKSVLSYKKPSFWLILTALLTCILVAVCFLTDPLKPDDSIKLTERHDSMVQYSVDLETIGSGSLYAEQWVNGTCVRSAPVTMTELVQDIQITMNERREDGSITGIDVQISTDQFGGSLMTFFQFPKDHSTIGWSFTTYEMDKTVSITSGTEMILAAMAFDLGNGVRAYDCETLINEPERLETADSMIIIRACWDSEPLPVQMEEPASIPKEVLRIEDVIMLSEKGQDLTWEDFENYDYYETGSGLYIRVHPIDDLFSLWIGGAGPDSEPVYIYLSTNDDSAASIDIRNGHVKEYVTDPVGMTYSQIQALFDTIESSPQTASSPQAYIEAHVEEYERLVMYDMFVLRYCFEQFLAEDQTGLHGHIMASVCQKVIENYEEALLIDGPMPATGQEWFDLLLQNAKTLDAQYNDEEMQRMYPVSWMLLTML